MEWPWFLTHGMKVDGKLVLLEALGPGLSLASVARSMTCSSAVQSWAST